MAAWVLAVWWFLVGWWRPDGCLDQGLSFDYRGWVCDLDAGPVRPAGILLTSHFLGLVAAVATTWAALLIRQNLRSKD